MIGLYVKAALWGAAAIAVLWLVDEIGDRREAKVDARYAAIEKKKQEAVESEAKAGEDARLPAFQPGSVARLKANWCRDCGEAK